MTRARQAVRAWLARRTDRERRLLAAAGGLALVVLAAAGIATLAADLRRLRARVEARTVELAAVRRLAAAASAAGDATGAAGDLLTRLQAAADAAGVGERVAAMTPAEDGAAPGARLAVRLSGASLAETVALLHALDQDAAGLGVARLALQKLPDDARRFDATLEVAGGRPR